MPDVIEQLPRFAAVCRQAAAAARGNSAATPAYWQALRAVTRQLHPFLAQSVVDGCTFPDRPIHLDADVACLLDFGITPRALALDLAGSPQGQGPDARPDPLYARLARSWSDDHRTSLVYNLDRWLQEQYRDRLDIDYAEELQRRLDESKQAMEDVPRQLRSIGLTPATAARVMEAFAQFRKITAASFQLERDKSSFTDRRGFASVLGNIEEVLEQATEELTRAGGGRARIRELFAAWKNSSYDAMQLTIKLRSVWAGTQLDARIQELARMLQAVFNTLVALCPEDAPDPRPQCILPPAEEVAGVLDRAAVRDAFEAVVTQDVVGAADEAGNYRELRRYGPLCALITPGTGRVRYAGDLRKALAAPDDGERKPAAGAAAPSERDLDVVRRLRYPLNVFVVPHRAEAASLDRQFAAAWFEYNVLARAKATKDALEDCRAAIPDIFVPPPEHASPAAFARERFVDLLTAYVRWRRDGSRPDPAAELPFDAFLSWAGARHPRPELLTPRRYEGPLAAFRNMSRRRRDEAWRQATGAIFGLDRELIALHLARQDFPAFFEALEVLPPAHRENTILARAMQEMAGQDLYGDRDRKVEALLRKYMEEDPDLKAAAIALETQLAIEIETQRAQTESLGRKFDFDREGEAVIQRVHSGLLGRRHELEERVDRYLLGLYHAIEGNAAAAVRFLLACLPATGGHRAAAAPSPPSSGGGEEGVDAGWFERNFTPVSGPFAKRPVPGVDPRPMPDVDFIYYNLGQLYRRLGATYEASLAFVEFLREAAGRPWHVHQETVREILAELRAGNNPGDVAV